MGRIGTGACPHRFWIPKCLNEAKLQPNTTQVAYEAIISFHIRVYTITYIVVLPNSAQDLWPTAGNCHSASQLRLNGRLQPTSLEARPSTVGPQVRIAWDDTYF